MGYSLKAEPVIAEILPGALVLGLLLFDRHEEDWILKDIDSAKTGAFFIGSWVLGNFIDAVRNLVEWALDEKKEWKINWNFLVEADQDKAQQFVHHYFSYYRLDANFVIGIFLLVILHFAVPPSWFGGGSHLSCYEFVFLLIFAVVFFLDACSLRKEMFELTKK